MKPRSSVRHRLAGHTAVLALLACLGPARAHAASEYELKAAVIYRMLHFVEWPAPPAGEALQLCVYGDNPFGTALEAITQQTVGGRELEVHSTAQASGLATCDVVFVSRSQESELPAAPAGTARLTVSDIPDFGCRGGMITLLLEGGRIRFSVNRDQTAASGLRVSAKLLELAAPLDCGSPS